MESKNKNIYILKVSSLRLFYIFSIQEQKVRTKPRLAAEGGREGTVCVCQNTDSTHS